MSIEFRPDKYRMDSLPNGKIEIVHTKAVLRGFGVVDRPEYKKSTVQARTEFREAFMADGGISKEEVQRMIDDNQKRAGAEPTTTTLTMDTAAVTKAVSEAVTTEVRTMVEGVSTRLKAVEDALTADTDRAMDVMKKKKKKDQDMADDDDMDGKKKKMKDKDMAAMDDAVETRSALIVTVQSILPKDFEVRGKSNQGHSCCRHW